MKYLIESSRAHLSIRLLAVIATGVFSTTSRLAAADSGELPPAIVQRSKEATVMVDLGKQGTGSGFLVHASGLFVTNRHVIQSVPSGKTVKLVLNSGQPDQQRLDARIVQISEDEDLALLKTDAPLKVKPLVLSDGAGLVELNRVVVLGYPFGKMLATGGDASPTISINAGRVSALRKDGAALERIQLDAATNPGNSGGPVITADGRVVGVVVSGIGGANVNFAIPAAAVMKMLRQPVMSLKAADTAFSKRNVVQDFEVEVIPTVPVPADAEIAVVFEDDPKKKRSFPALRKGAGFSFKAALVQTAKPLRLRLESQIGVLMIRTNMNDCPVKVGTRNLQLSEIREMKTEGKLSKTTLVHFDEAQEQFETVDGKPSGIPALPGEMNQQMLNLDKSWSLKVGAYDPGPLDVPYQIVMSAKGKALATTRGRMTFRSPPAGLQQDGDDDDTGFGIASIMMMRMGGGGQTLDLLKLIEPSNDTRAGNWERKGAALETITEPAAWCDVPVVPTRDYQVQMEFVPNQNAEGELLIHLPVGRSHALLRLNGSAKGRAKLELVPGRAVDGAGEVPVAAFEKDKEVDLSVNVASHGEDVRVVVMMGQNRPLFWTGKIKHLAEPKEGNIPADRLTIGHLGLSMKIKSLSISAPSSSLRVLREWPARLYPEAAKVIASWDLDRAPSGKKLIGIDNGEHFATLIGSPQYLSNKGVLGSGALKLGGKSAGFELRECPHTNRGSHPERTVSMWFLADDTSNKEARQYLLDMGGKDKGFAVYLRGGTLHAGGWDSSHKTWKGTWLKADGITAGKWHHLALVIAGKDERSTALRLLLDGNEVAKGEGHGISDHEPVAFGTTLKTTRSCDTDPLDAAAKNQQFAGMLDMVQLYNSVLSVEALKHLAGARYSQSPN